MVEHTTFNRGVTGSSPVGVADIFFARAARGASSPCALGTVVTRVAVFNVVQLDQSLALCVVLAAGKLQFNVDTVTHEKELFVGKPVQVSL